MSDSSTTETRSDNTRFVQLWTEALAQALLDISGSAFPCAFLEEPLAQFPEASEQNLWIIATLSGSLRGEMSLRLPVPSAVRLGQIFMSEPAAAAAEISQEHRDAVLELLRQVGGRFATAVTSTWGEVQIRLDASPASPSWPASFTAWIRLGDDAAPNLIELRLSAALVAALRAERNLAPQPSDAASYPADSAPHDKQVNLHALMDVELGVILRFGSRRLLLREVLDLSPGAVIELDRQVQEPVDLLLDGRVVARGDIVVVDGNYGLRVTEVAPAGS